MINFRNFLTANCFTCKHTNKKTATENTRTYTIKFILPHFSLCRIINKISFSRQKIIDFDLFFFLEYVLMHHLQFSIHRRYHILRRRLHSIHRHYLRLRYRQGIRRMRTKRLPISIETPESNQKYNLNALLFKWKFSDCTSDLAQDFKIPSCIFNETKRWITNNRVTTWIHKLFLFKID